MSRLAPQDVEVNISIRALYYICMGQSQISSCWIRILLLIIIPASAASRTNQPIIHYVTPVGSTVRRCNSSDNVNTLMSRSFTYKSTASRPTPPVEEAARRRRTDGEPGDPKPGSVSDDIRSEVILEDFTEKLCEKFLRFFPVQNYRKKLSRA